MYDTIFDNYTSAYNGILATPLKTDCYIGTKHPFINESGLYTSPQIKNIPITTIVKFTGRFFPSIFTNEICFQIIYNNNQFGYLWEYNLIDWKRTQTTTTDTDRTVISAQSELDQLIENNKVILENNLLCARSILLLDDASIDCPSHFRQNLFDIHKRLIQRNQSIIDSNTTQDITQSHSPNMDTYNQTLVNFMNNPGIGFIISTTAAIIIIAVVAVVSAAIAYKLFKTLNAESKLDLKYSDSLTADLIKYLPPEVHEQLMAENEANQRKANDAINSASGKTLLKTASYLGAGFIGFYILDKFIIKTKA